MITDDDIRQGKYAAGRSDEQPRIPEFFEILDKSKEIHVKKNKDYASESNPFSNFERSATLISWFTNPTDMAFVALVATKLARIAELSDGRTPNNESLDDSFLDLVTYCGLWAAYKKRGENPLQREIFDLLKYMPDFQTEQIIEYILRLREARQHAKRDITSGSENTQRRSS